MSSEKHDRNQKQQVMYMQHMKNMEEAVKKVDNDPPALDPELYVSVGSLVSAQARLHEAEAANRQLIQSINRIYRSKGEVSCHQQRQYYTTSYYARMVQNLHTEKYNKQFLQMLQLSNSRYNKQRQLEEFGEHQRKMIKNSKYPDFYKTDLVNPLEKWSICPIGDDENPEKITSMPSKRVKCFLDFEIIGERKLGRMFIEIYKDYVPIAGENFLHFIKAENGCGYRNSSVYRIKPKFGLLGGDVENRNGASTITAYGRPFAHENHLLKFAGPGVVAAFTLVPGLNFCHFFISFKALPFLQDQFVVIGRVIKNSRTLEMIEEFGTASGVPLKPIVIENCGIWQASQKKT